MPALWAVEYQEFESFGEESLVFRDPDVQDTSRAEYYWRLYIGLPSCRDLGLLFSFPPSLQI